MNALAISDRVHLAKLLGLLGSDHVGGGEKPRKSGAQSVALAYRLTC